MKNTKRKQHDIPIHTFKPDQNMKFRHLFFMGIVTLLFGVVAWGVLHPTSESQWFLIVIIPLYAYLVWLSFLETTQKLHIYKDGIVHIYGKRRRFLRWEDMLRFEWRSQGKTSTAGLVSRAPIQDEISGTAIHAFLNGKQDQYFIRLSEMIDIPTQSDGWFRQDIDLDALRDKKFGQVFYDYAPHLFEKGKIS